MAASAALHVGLILAVTLVPGLIPHGNQESWGNSADKGVKVGVVSKLPGIPLPSPPVVHENTKPNTTSKTLNPPETAPKAVEKKPVKADVQLPSKNAKAAPKKEPPSGPTKTVTAAQPTTVAPNAIPGAGGQVDLAFGQRGSGEGPASFGDGNFGTRFPEYVNSMTRAIELKWRDNITSIPRGASPRVYVTFRLNKAGKPSLLEVAETSGSAALDSSAQRAILAANIPPLPAAYSGSTVDVRFSFEYKR